MNINKDFKAYIALALLSLGLVCTIIALSTNHWYDVNTDVSEPVMIKSRQTMGLWKICSSVDVVEMKYNFSTCFNVNEPEELLKLSNQMVNLGRLGDSGSSLDTSGDDIFHRMKRFVSSVRSKRNIDDNPLGHFDDLGDFGDLNDLGDLDDFLGNAGDGSSDKWPNDGSDSGDEYMRELKKQLYPDYLKAIQGLEILAGIAGLLSVIVWMAFIIMSAMSRKTTLRFVVFGLTVAACVFHVISTIIWEKEKENDKPMTNPPGQSIMCGWSFGMACLSGILHLLSIAPVFMTKTNQPDDGMEQSLTP